MFLVIIWISSQSIEPAGFMYLHLNVLLSLEVRQVCQSSLVTGPMHSAEKLVRSGKFELKPSCLQLFKLSTWQGLWSQRRRILWIPRTTMPASEASSASRLRMRRTSPTSPTSPSRTGWTGWTGTGMRSTPTKRSWMRCGFRFVMHHDASHWHQLYLNVHVKQGQPL